MSKKNELISIEDNEQLTKKEVNIKKVTQQAEAIGDLLDNLGIKEATFVNGNYYKHEPMENKRKIVTKDIIVEEKENTFNITIPKANADESGIIAELSENNTQKAIASFIGRTQSWVSMKKNSDEE